MAHAPLSPKDEVPQEISILKTGNGWELNLIDRMSEKMGFSFHVLRIVLSISALSSAAKLIFNHFAE
ncbi:MAG: hypothetical protein A2X94_15965 [Bdellovibrionales bacterium GWB1_55_8]|nr:MAG: hypothetical protein A2X94_15965 [Bdellovibrionales bacterium GWB1_55_8]